MIYYERITTVFLFMHGLVGLKILRANKSLNQDTRYSRAC